MFLDFFFSRGAVILILLGNCSAESDPCRLCCCFTAAGAARNFFSSAANLLRMRTTLRLVSRAPSPILEGGLEVSNGQWKRVKVIKRALKYRFKYTRVDCTCQMNNTDSKYLRIWWKLAIWWDLKRYLRLSKDCLPSSNREGLFWFVT